MPLFRGKKKLPEVNYFAYSPADNPLLCSTSSSVPFTILAKDFNGNAIPSGVMCYWTLSGLGSLNIYSFKTGIGGAINLTYTSSATPETAVITLLSVASTKISIQVDMP
jgi:hypothetical protein